MRVPCRGLAIKPSKHHEFTGNLPPNVPSSPYWKRFYSGEEFHQIVEFFLLAGVRPAWWQCQSAIILRLMDMLKNKTLRRQKYPLGWLGGILCLGLALSYGCAEPVPERPRNVILISIDTLRPDMLGAYGYPKPTSPALDAFAKEGVLFENAVSVAPWTLPAHGSMLTGVYPRRHGAVTDRNALRPDVPTLAEILSQAGFKTAAFTNSTYLVKRFGFDRGNDQFVYVFESQEAREPSQVFDKAMSWLSSRKTDEPFFLFVHDYSVHSDYKSLPEFEEMFRKPYEGVANGSTSQLVFLRSGGIDLTEKDTDHLVDLYISGIRQLDSELEKFFAYLKVNELDQETLVILVSDHGEAFLEHGDVMHGETQYDEELRVPLVLRGPGLPAGKRVPQVASLIDIVPTVLSILGWVPRTEDWDGMDLSVLWHSRPGEVFDERVLFSEADHHYVEEPDIFRSARHKDMKLIFNRATNEKSLFDLSKDPGEQEDVSGQYPEMMALLGSALEDFGETREVSELLPELSEEEQKHLEALGYIQ